MIRLNDKPNLRTKKNIMNNSPFMHQMGGGRCTSISPSPFSLTAIRSTTRIILYQRTRGTFIMKTSQLKNSLLLLLAAAIWGFAFVAQSVGMEYVGPFTFNMTRNIIGGLVLIPCIFLLRKINPADTPAPASCEQASSSPNDALVCKTTAQRTPNPDRLVWVGGICCGLCLAVASSLQQLGIQYTTVGRAGFITACYIVLVPIFNLILFKKKCNPIIWFSVILSVIGLYLLCMQGSFALGKGEVLVMFCAVAFSFHILTIDHFAPFVDCVKMSCIQFFVCGIICAVPAFLLENPQISDMLNAWMPILYAGVLSSGVAYTLQIVGQKNMNPTVASLILSMESCISVLAGWLLLQQKLSFKELFGCVLMFGAIVLAQLPEKSTPAQK